MGLDKETAARLAEERLAEWRRLSYGEWRVMLEDRELRQVVGEDGKRYSVACHGLDDGEGRVRMVVAVDDGGWSAFVPLVRVEIMNPDGTFLD
ncbi:hypothetical protein DDE19_24960 [Micromonospora ureilytica]|uniref:Uncharacterized protein n=1 Tax=Micromonospora ureilytica TaxID=709868 RepID=A0A3N9XL20_9ACTN|nr:hypothetical protein [Micromonospora ureilytica]RQX13815.1 hypothetical protein DDE19_24960 [Micromonospora ureilytica]